MDQVLNPKAEKQVIYEIYKACRLCGAGAGYKMPIIQNVVDLDDQEVQLKQKIRECVQIEVHQNDKMPPLICELCVDKVNDFYEFLDMCRQTNNRTRYRLGLPPQSSTKGTPDAGDCILGLTEPVYVNSDSEGEPLSKHKKPQVGHLKKIKKKEPELRVKLENYIPKQESRATRFRIKRQRTPPRVTRHSKPSRDNDDVALSSLVENRKPKTSPKLQPKSILKKEVKSEDASLLVPRLKRPREREPIKIEVPNKRVKITLKPLSSRLLSRSMRLPLRPTRSSAPPTRSSPPPARSSPPPTRSAAPPSRSTAPPSRSTAPPSRSTARPTAPMSRSTAHPSRTSAPTSRSSAPPTRTSAPPSRSTAPPTRSTVPTSRSPASASRSPAPPSRTSGPLSRTSGPLSRTSTPTSRSSAPSPRSPAPASRSSAPPPRSPARPASPRPQARRPSPPRSLACDVCKLVSKTPQGYASHVKIHSVGYTSLQLACNACGVWFPTTEEAEAHHNWHKTRCQAYTCRRCTADFQHHQTYDDHFGKKQCIPWDIVPDVKCDECWHEFATNKLLEEHKCGGSDARPGGKCPKCKKSYSLLKNLRRHERFCAVKRKVGELMVDPELLDQVKPIQVRVARCDPLLSNIKQEHFDVSSVSTDFGLDRNCFYPYISSVSSLRFKSEPDELDSMVSIKQEIKDEFCTEENYVHWDSDSDTNSEPEVTDVMGDSFAKKKRINSLTKLSIKTIFSQRCLGKVPKKIKRVNMEHGFDSLLASNDNDDEVRKDIDDIINNLGNDDDGNDSQEIGDDTAKKIESEDLKNDKGNETAEKKDENDMNTGVSSSVADIRSKTLDDNNDISKKDETKGENKDISQEKNDKVKSESNDTKDYSADFIDGVSSDVPKDQDKNANDTNSVSKATMEKDSAAKDLTNDNKNYGNDLSENKKTLNEDVSAKDPASIDGKNHQNVLKSPQPMDASSEIMNGELDTSNDKSREPNYAVSVIRSNDNDSHSTVNNNTKIDDNDIVSNDKNLQSENILNSKLEQSSVSNDMMANDKTVTGHNDVDRNINTSNDKKESSKNKEINDNIISKGNTLSSNNDSIKDFNENPSAVKTSIREDDVTSMEDDRRLMEEIDAQLGENTDECNDKLVNDRGNDKINTNDLGAT